MAPQLWSAHVLPGQTEKILSDHDIHITNAALAETITDYMSRTTLRLAYKIVLERSLGSEVGKETSTTLCSLIPGKIEQCSLNIYVPHGQRVFLDVIGKNEIYLTGTVGEDNPKVASHDLTPKKSKFPNSTASPSRYTALSDITRPSAMVKSVGTFKPMAPLPSSVGFSLSPKPSSSIPSPDFTARPMSSSSHGSPLIPDKGKKKVLAAPASASALPSSAQSETGSGATGGTDETDKLPSLRTDGYSVIDRNVGTGEAVGEGSIVVVHFYAKYKVTVDTPAVTYESSQPGKPFHFTVGSGSVVRGFDLGIRDMRVGGQRRIMTTSALGFGEKEGPYFTDDSGTARRVPPNVYLVFGKYLISR
ncbi:hypothetical protein NLJ89_g10810 [Agrocybe chaxingu]|uniref:peptidylprolyl isomerase n=1 Tax=Agrocybe chaxingu TaxID=84603 RepID=A0A9W8MRS0_9AGAR|nr:hypothetical protein NLJ89_g10810 [Agrocybe chaxingu]